MRGRAQREICSWKALAHRPPFAVGCCKLSLNYFFHFLSIFPLGNVKRMKIGQLGELTEASDVVVGQVQV